MSLKLNLIAACCENMGIGINGRLPWKLKNELKYFNEMTTRVKDESKQNVVIMGRKTWFGIPPKFRPLPNRINIVLSRDSELKLGEEAIVKGSLQEALDMLTQPEYAEKFEKIWIVGGSSVYKEAMDHKLFNRLYLTRIKAHFDCDAFMPAVPENFKLTKDSYVPEEEQEENGIKYSFLVYEKGN